MQQQPLKVILFNGKEMHHKNLEALEQYDKIEFEHITDISDITKIIHTNHYDAIYSPVYPIDLKSFNPPLPSHLKFIFGPHFSVFPNQEQLKQIIHPNTIYIQPSIWASNVWRYHSEKPIELTIQPIPFCVNTTKFQPLKFKANKTEIFIYYKNREPDDVRYIYNYFMEINQPVTVFHYKNRYNEEDYLKTLQHAKYGIWVGAHESQGFALLEALSCNVPLLVWNINGMDREYGGNYPPFQATTIPYWSNLCGEYFYHKEEFIDKLNTLINNLDSYKPRQFILDNLSVDVCQNKFIELIK